MGSKEEELYFKKWEAAYKKITKLEGLVVAAWYDGWSEKEIYDSHLPELRLNISEHWDKSDTRKRLMELKNSVSSLIAPDNITLIGE